MYYHTLVCVNGTAYEGRIKICQLAASLPEAGCSLSPMAAEESRRVVSAINKSGRGRVRRITLIYALESAPTVQLWLMGCAELVFSPRVPRPDCKNITFAEVHRALDTISRQVKGHSRCGSFGSNFVRSHRRMFAGSRRTGGAISRDASSSYSIRQKRSSSTEYYGEEVRPAAVSGGKKRGANIHRKADCNNNKLSDFIKMYKAELGKCESGGFDILQPEETSDAERDSLLREKPADWKPFIGKVEYPRLALAKSRPSSKRVLVNTFGLMSEQKFHESFYEGH